MHDGDKNQTHTNAIDRSRKTCAPHAHTTHISSDLVATIVVRGLKSIPYRERQPPRPLQKDTAPAARSTILVILQTNR